MSGPQDTPPLRLLRRPEVERLTGLKTSAIYAAMKAGTFPRPLPIGMNAVAWISVEVEAWIAQRVLARDRPQVEQVAQFSDVQHLSRGHRLIRRPEVEAKTGKSRSAIYAEMKAGTFPASIILADNAVAWLESEVDGWIAQRLTLRNQRTPPRPSATWATYQGAEHL